MSSPNKPEPPPAPNAHRPVWELVVEDMKERDRVGRAKYGTPLQPFNGRDPLVDAYQEALDLAVYLRQAIEERYAPMAAALAAVQVVAGGGITPMPPGVTDPHDQPVGIGQACAVPGCTVCPVDRRLWRETAA